MKAVKSIISILITIGIIFYLIGMPSVIKGNVRKSRISSWYREKESFTGIIDIWHIVGFKAHTGSISTWLEKRAKEFEKNHSGVFCNITAMDEDEYKSRIEKGQRADIYSFPCGFEYSDRFMPLDENEIPQIRENLKNKGKSGNMTYSVPYMYSGYCLCTNDDLLLKNAVNITDDITVPDINAMEEEISGNSIIGAICGFEKPFSSEEDFKAGKCCFCVSDFRLVGDLERKNANGKGFAVSAHPLCDFTDEVQFIGIDSDTDTRKITYVYEIINIILSEKAQIQLTDNNVYPVIEINDLNIADKYTSIPKVLMSDYHNPTVPNAFEYKRNKDMLLEDAKGTLMSDMYAKDRFFERLELITE